jgi:hypothetical protein
MTKKEIIKKLEIYDIFSRDGLYHSFYFCERETHKYIPGYKLTNINITALRDNLLFYKVIKTSAFRFESTDIILSSVKQEGFWDIKHLKSEYKSDNLCEILNKNLINN